MTKQNGFNDYISKLTKVYVELVRNTELVIGYKMNAKDGVSNCQIELWELSDSLLIYRHSSTSLQRTFEFYPKEQIELAIENVEMERVLCMPYCIGVKQFLNKNELEIHKN